MGKYDKYFITDTPTNPIHPSGRIKGNPGVWENTHWINDELSQQVGIPTVPNAFYMEPNMCLRPSKGKPGQGRPQIHSWDEYMWFLGTDPDDPFDLGGEVEIWIENEEHHVTKTTALFIPKGMQHCPLFFHRIDRPFFFITTGSTLRYRHLSYSRDTRWGPDDAPMVNDDALGLPPLVRHWTSHLKL